MMRIAVCSGSFDPITFGHLDIIRRAAKLFDQVVVLVAVNPDKKMAFSVEERVEFIHRTITDLQNVKVDTFAGLLVDYAKTHHIQAIVRGLRAVSDFEYEFQMALTNKKLWPGVETVFLTPSMEYMYLSSSIVRSVAQFGGDISLFLPGELVADVAKKLRR